MNNKNKKQLNPLDLFDENRKYSIDDKNFDAMDTFIDSSISKTSEPEPTASSGSIIGHAATSDWCFASASINGNAVTSTRYEITGEVIANDFIFVDEHQQEQSLVQKLCIIQSDIDFVFNGINNFNANSYDYSDSRNLFDRMTDPLYSGENIFQLLQRITGDIQQRHYDSNDMSNRMMNLETMICQLQMQMAELQQSQCSDS